MLKIDKSSLPESDKYREIAIFHTEKKKFKNKSIYLYYKDQYSEGLEKVGRDIFSLSDVEEIKSKSGRDGALLRKCDIKYIYSKIKNPNLDNLLNYLEDEGDVGMNDRRREAITRVYNKCLEELDNMTKDPSRHITSIHFSREELGEDGYLVPLPISNFSKEELKFIREGKTNYLEKKGDKWYAKEVVGDKVEKLLDTEAASERKLLVEPEHQQISEEEVELIESKYFGGPEHTGNLGFNKYNPSGEEMIEITYIYGPNRSGKTYYAARYAKLWSEKFVGWPIFLFSRRDKDKVLDDLENLKRVEIDERLVTEPLSMTDFENSLVIFDDIDTITDKKICQAIQKLRDDIMETGRQKMIYVINTSHQGMNWKPTRTVLNEANSYTLFPRKGNYGHNFKILKDKMGLEAKVIKEIIGKPNGLAYKGKWGWITIYKDSPQYIIYENGIHLL